MHGCLEPPRGDVASGLGAPSCPFTHLALPVPFPLPPRPTHAHTRAHAQVHRHHPSAALSPPFPPLSSTRTHLPTHHRSIGTIPRPSTAAPWGAHLRPARAQRCTRWRRGYQAPRLMASSPTSECWLQPSVLAVPYLRWALRSTHSPYWLQLLPARREPGCAHKWACISSYRW